MTLFNISGGAGLTSDVDGTLSTPIHPTGSGTVTSTLAGTLTVPVRLTGNAGVTSALAATLTTPFPLTGSGSITSGLSATLTTPITLTGSGTISSGLSGDASMIFSVSGSGAVTSALSGILTPPIEITGSGAITSGLTGTLTNVLDITGSGAITSSLTATLTPPIELTGTGGITSDLPATLTVPFTLTGTGGITSDLSATLTVPFTLTGTGAITSALTGALTPPINVSGSGSLTSTLAGDLSVPLQLTGSASVTTGLTATLTVPVQISGAGTITSDLSGTLDLPDPLTSPRVTSTTSGFANLQRGTGFARTGNLDITITGTQTPGADLNLLIADPKTLVAQLSIEIQGTETSVAGLSAGIQGTETITSSTDVLVQGTNQVSSTTSLTIQGTETAEADTSVTIQGTETVTTGLAVLASFGIQTTTDVLIQGTLTVDAPTDVTVQGTEQRDVLTDVNVTLGLPYRLMKVYGDHVSRPLGGNASDANFPEQFLATPGGAVITTSNGNYGVTAQGLRYVGLNTIPTAGAYDKYSLPLGASDPLTTGFRMLAYFTVDTLGANGSVVLGMFADQQSPLVDFGTSDVLAFGLEVENGQTIPRLWYGGGGGFVSSSINQGIGNAVNYVGRRLIVEIEVVGAGSVEARLFDQDIDLDHPLTTLALTGGVVTAVDRFSLTTVGRRNAAAPSNDQIVILQHVDVEPSGSLYDASAGVTLGAAKWRPYRDRVPVELLQAGTNTITTLLSDDGITATDPGSDSIVLDETEPQLSLVAFLPDSSVILPGSTNPQIVKGSLQPGFDTVQIKWTANQTGQWSLRLNSTSVLDGIEIQSGAYGVAGAEHVVQFSFAEFPLGDGIYEVTLYLVSDSGRPTARRVGDFLLP